MTEKIPKIDQFTSNRRRRAFEQAFASSKLEGLNVDEEFKAETERYITGEISFEDLLRRSARICA